jgi:hypothetical protein
MAETDCRDPQDSQVMNEIRVSFVRSVSGDLHVLHVTYSTVKCIRKLVIADPQNYHFRGSEL